MTYRDLYKLYMRQRPTYDIKRRIYDIKRRIYDIQRAEKIVYEIETYKGDAFMTYRTYREHTETYKTHE